MRTHIYIAVSLLLYPLAALSEQYLCVPDKMTGFSFDARKKEWDYTQFRTNFKYVIAPAKNGRDAFALTKVGEKDPEGYCNKSFNDGGVLFCQTLLGDFRFNKINGRYFMSSTLGYYAVGAGMWAATDADSPDLAIQIGKCSPF